MVIDTGPVSQKLSGSLEFSSGEHIIYMAGGRVSNDKHYAWCGTLIPDFRLDVVHGDFMALDSSLSFVVRGEDEDHRRRHRRHRH